MIRLVFASDSFKGSLTCADTAELLARAAREVFGDCECAAAYVADGGEGTAEAVTKALAGRMVSARVCDPLMNSIRARYGIIGDTAVIEMAAASGLTLVPEALRDPMLTTTYGTGQLILDALDRGCRRLYVAIGGSATNDGGMGCMRALGARFLDSGGRELSGAGRDLADVAHIDLEGLDKRLSDTGVTVLRDVRNPLCGADGATRTFAEQKGATPEAVELLENGMRVYRDAILRQFGADCDAIQGAGAAGGLGAALSVFLRADMRSGIDTILDLIGFDRMLEGADFAVTGEGRADGQSCQGKVMQGVALRARAAGVPVYGLCGSLGQGAEGLYECGVTALYSLADEQTSVRDAIADAGRIYYRAALSMFRDIAAGSTNWSE